MQIKKRERAYDGYFKVNKLTVEQEGQTFTREQFDRGSAVCALVYDTEAQQYILTKQFRIGAESELIEIVAGIIDEGEEPEQSIRREIEEEIGYHVNHLQHLYTFYSSPGGSTENVKLYYAEVSEQHAAGGGSAHENEYIEIVRCSAQELENLETHDAKTIIAQQWVKLQQR